MSENIITNVEQNANENNQEITVKYILEQVEKIRSDSKYIYDALEKLEGVALSATVGDIGAQAKAQGIETVVKCRETTNQQMLRFYEKLYDDLMVQKQDRLKEKIELIKNAFDRNMAFISDGDISSDDKYAALTYVTDKIENLLKIVLEQDPFIKKFEDM